MFCIVAFIDAPISFLVTRLIPSSIHPVVFRTDSGPAAFDAHPVFAGAFRGDAVLAFALYRIAARINSDALEVETLKELLEAADAQAQRAAADEALERLRAAGARVASGAGAGAGDAAAAGIAPEAAVRNHNPEVVGSNQAVQQGEAAAGVASVPSDSPKED